jgi:glycosyltransferase involved in cell wall biosynthesis
VDARPCVLIVINGAAVGLPFGGAERFGLELALALDRERWRPSVLALFSLGGDAETVWAIRLRGAGVPLIFATEALPGEDCRPGEYGPRYLRALRRMPRLLEGQRVDLVHSNSQWGSVAMLVLRHRLGDPMLIRTAHLPKEWGKNNAARWLFADAVFPLSFAATVGVSPEVCRRLDRRLGARLAGKRLRYIPNAMDYDRFAAAQVDRAAVRAEFGIPPGVPVVGAVGRLTRQKGHADLLDAMALLAGQVGDVRLLLVGDGELRPALEEQAASLGLGERVIFAGARPDVERTLRAMDVFAMSSLWEGLPTVVMEAMAAGVPVVATDIPGNNDLVRHGETGWLVAVSDARAMAERLRLALEDAQRSVVAERARSDVAEHYSMRAVAGRYADLYDSLLGSPSAAKPTR